ncbi:dienelactone hydrolase family protein [Sinomicrobium soli]|uniref:dienelactone hydrolase family protein n=1 Tax=Sinomicrobium sp. N-1-3-6 TaxID=2219864 RepID=UPI000DCD2EF5|nr:dienelactone hydrolase family protein [Sinomicrobium sp. N-1-3-6]RAV27723.1 hypothetical protein DN748_17020 [Sinomicrobium sp. N-1-3-6]
MLKYTLKYGLVALCLTVSLHIFSQDLHLRKGTVNDSVAVPGTELLSYSVYLPDDYSTAKKWPLFFVFDLEGGSTGAINALLEAPGAGQAILIAPDQLTEESYEANFYVAKKLFDLVFRSFSVDKGRIYTAGFGEGGRLATAVAVLSDDVDGVLAVGGAIPGHSSYVPVKNDFVFVGMAGDESTYYREMQGTISLLESRKFQARMVVYDGNGHYPDARYTDRALRILTLQSMAKGAVPSVLKDSLFEADMVYNKWLEGQGRALNAFDELGSMREHYPEDRFKDVLKERKKTLRKNDTFRKQRRDSYGIEEEETFYMEDYISFLSADILTGDTGQLPSWEGELNALDKPGKEGNIPRRKMARRIRNMLEAAIEATIAKGELKDNQLLFANAFLVLLDPEAEDACLEVIRYSTKNSEYGMALFYLEQLLKNGFTDVARLNAMEDIALLRILPEYSDILEENGLKTLY